MKARDGEWLNEALERLTKTKHEGVAVRGFSWTGYAETHRGATPAPEDGPWIQTKHGKAFYLLNPREEDILIEDIAFSLSRQCRFTGHVDSYTVAEHSVRVSWEVPRLIANQGLMHDSAEAYTSDVAAPLKSILKPLLSPVEASIERVIARKFSLSFPWADEVKRADLILLATERDALLSTPPKPWFIDEIGYLPSTKQKIIKPWGKRKAYGMFMARYRELFENGPKVEIE